MLLLGPVELDHNFLLLDRWLAYLSRNLNTSEALPAALEFLPLFCTVFAQDGRGQYYAKPCPLDVLFLWIEFVHYVEF